MSPFSRFAIYYVAVVRCGSLRKAAEQLHISASAINRQILQAEADFGTPLFERLADGLRMTTAGELLYADLLRWQREFDVTKQRFDEIQGLQRGVVKIGLVQALNQGIIADCLAQLAVDYPALRLEITSDSSHGLAYQLRDAEIDVALLLDPGEVRGVEVRAFCEMEMGIVLPNQHPLSGQSTLRLTDVYSERQIIAGENLVVHSRVMALYQRSQIIPDNSIICNDIPLIRHLVKQQGGISLLSRLDVLHALTHRELCFIPLSDKSVKPLTLALSVSPARQLSKAAQQVIMRLSAVIETMKA
ncbi:LysR family transcriptional regulator [Rosenbergiella australiborealis]|uniref:LysR family transcriptional regulator n=1 Tax=Rosenbergiella australiborealis TaxID=1544696 RepID=UPI001F4DF540|nr:LysR family transcriptional regulator [Rosenbergiella australiborealis]